MSNAMFLKSLVLIGGLWIGWMLGDWFLNRDR